MTEKNSNFLISTSKFLRYWLPVVAWAGIIFYFSSMPSLESGWPTTADWVLRKGAHIVVYAILTLLLFRALHNGHGVQTKTALVWAAILALLYAFSDEFHQHFVPGRHGRIRDITVDAIGIAMVLLPANKRKEKIPDLLHTRT